KTVPVAAPAAGADRDAGGSDAGQAAENEAPDADTAAPAPDPAADHPANHGADVSAAAQTVTPTGFDNHGQYVRSVATANHGQEVGASHAKAARPGARANT